MSPRSFLMATRQSYPVDPGGSWGAALAIALTLVVGALGALMTDHSGGIPGPATTVTIRVDQGTSVTIWERTTDTNVLTYSVATLTGPGATFDSLAAEHYTFTSDGVYLKIHCFRDAHSEGTATGNNIAGARLDGVPGYPSGIWASIIVSYALGYGGIESSRVEALGSDLSTITFMGDQDSELVLGFTADASNTAPAIASFTATSASEGSPVTFTASASDPDGDALSYSFDFESDGTWDVSGPDPVVMHVYGDDFSGVARLRVSDGDAFTEATTAVSVANVPPAIHGVVGVTAVANVTLRVAGEKWHDVSLVLYQGGAVAAEASVIRTPGSPDDQAVTIDGLVFELLSGKVSAVVQYTPLDDPINGQINGANPAWLVLTGPEGTEVRLHHTFNVRHPETWTWTLEDFRAYLVGFPIRFEGPASDPGSDDLTFSWSWGDGSVDTVTTYFNNGVGPDGRVSPEVRPIAVTDVVTHAFASGGTFTVTLVVSDDDGGIASATMIVTL